MVHYAYIQFSGDDFSDNQKTLEFHCFLVITVYNQQRALENNSTFALNNNFLMYTSLKPDFVGLSVSWFYF